MKTIAAISTPLENGGLAVIRISGEAALDIADAAFMPFKSEINGGIRPSKMNGNSCQYGKIVRDGRTIDDVVLTVFRAPHSYTGLDTAEISCHGGVYVAKEILRFILDLGAQPASAGEFTKLAFVNGKLSLTQAEAVMDIINAEGEAALRSARLIKEGALYRRIKSVCKDLVGLLGSLAAWNDYPDEDIPETDTDSILRILDDSIAVISQILKDYDNGRVLREGIDTAIVGRPNVGKSTLMNALLGYDRSIVTTAEGTTRDIIEETVRLGDIKLKLSDTAGMRDTENEAELIGVELARRKLADAELVLCVLDGSSELSQTDMAIMDGLKNRRHIVIINKSDLPQKIDAKYITSKNILYVSASKGSGIKEISEEISKMFINGSSSDGAQLYANERQRSLCEHSSEYLLQARQAVLDGITLDGVTVLIDEAANSLLTLSGEKATEAVVNDVFSRFCVGK